MQDQYSGLLIGKCSVRRLEMNMSASSKIKVGMLGIGNIGRGTYQALEMNHDKILETTGLDIEIVKILNRHPEKDRGIDIPKEKYTTDVREIIEDPEIGMVVELIGGIEPATEYMAEAMKHGKSVVTANKALSLLTADILQNSLRKTMFC